MVSNEADLRADSNDSSPMCVSCKITKLFKLFLHRSEREHTIVALTQLTGIQIMNQVPVLQFQETSPCQINALSHMTF